MSSRLTKTSPVLLLAVAGLALTGCRSTADGRAARRGADAPVTPVSEPTGEPASTITTRNPDGGTEESTAWPDEVAWTETVASSIENEPKVEDRFDGLSLFGEVAGRARPSERAESGLGSDPFDVTQVTFTSVGSDFDPRLTPDGSHVYFASTRHRETADIYIKPVNGRAVRQITTDPSQDVMPSISPDGTRIAFASDRAGTWDIYVTDVNGGQAQPITTSTGHSLHPTWSPDGSRLAFCRLGEMSGRWEIWITDVDNPLVSYHVGYGLFPEWAPTPGTGIHGGDRVLFQRARERGSRLFSVWTLEVVGTEVGNLTEIASDPDAALINPSWSADGLRVAFSRVLVDPQDASGATPRDGDVYLMNIDGTGLTGLTADGSINLMPAWGGSDRVYFVSDRTGENNIWSLDVSDALLAAGTPSLEQAPITARTPSADPAITGGRKSPAGEPDRGLTTFTEPEQP